VVYLVEQYCANGTLADFLRYNKYFVGRSFRYVVCADIANGMAYLHRQNLIHGNLSLDKCHAHSRRSRADCYSISSLSSLRRPAWNEKRVAML